MSHATLRQRMQEVRKRWTVAERKRRSQAARRRCAALLARFDATPQDPNTFWAAGAMSLSDVARIAG